MKHIISVFACSLLIAFFCTPGSYANPPAEIAFQGRMLNPETGGVVSDGNYSIVFSLYTVETGGTAEWQETQTVAVKDGVYSVKLGSQTAFGTLSFNQVLYLGIKIEDDNEMTPRLKLTASPHAFNAGKLADKESSYYLDWDNITDMPAGFADGVDNEGSGEANTASNAGTAGVGVYKQKTGTDLELRNINAGSDKITVTLDSANNEVDIDADASEIVTSATVDAAAAVMDSDFSGTDGFMRKTGDSTYEVIKCNLDAAVAPTADEDTDDGYAVGSIWVDTTADISYLCLDASSGAAVWKETSSIAAGEANTGSNVGTAGVGVYKQKNGTDLELRNINAGSNKVTVTLDAANNEIDIDVNEANLSVDVDADASTISNLELDNLKAGVLDTDLSTVSGSDNTLGSAKAIKTYVDAQIPITDTSAFLKDDADNTKLLRFELGGLTSGATRVATPPDSDFTMARTDDAQSFTGAQSFLGAVNLQDALNILDSGNDHNAGISVADLGADRAYTIPEAGADASFVMSAGNQTIGGEKTFSSNVSCPVADRTERFGNNAGDSVTTSAQSVYLGHNAGTAITSGGYNVAVGCAALESASTSAVNVAVGHQAAQKLTGGAELVAIGAGALKNHTNPTSSTAVGTNAMGDCTEGTNNTAVGDDAMRYSYGSNNTAVGRLAGNKVKGDRNVFIGYSAGDESNGDDSEDCVFVGYNAGYNCDQEKNVCIGSQAGQNINEYGNTLIGFQAGLSLTTKTENTCIGAYSGANADATGFNTFVGYGSAYNCAGERNTVVGNEAGENMSSANYNVLIGDAAGKGLGGGDSNIIIGYQACDSGSPTGSVAIGDNANVTGNNSIGLGRAVTNGSANTFVAGSDTAAMNNVYFGRGISSATPSAYTVSGTASSANGTNGGAIKISGGIANQASDDGGAIELQTAGGGAGTTRTTRVKITPGGLTSLYKGADVASAASITPSGNLFHVTGTTNIDTIDATDVTAGTRITIIFDAVLTLNDDTDNLKLAGNFTTSADDTITLVFDGANWYEVSRSAN